MELGYVRAREKRRPDLTFVIRLLVILGQFLPDLPGGGSDYRILAGVVIRIPAKYRDAKRPFFYRFRLLLQSTLGNVLKKQLAAAARLELRTREDSVDLFPNVVRLRLREAPVSGLRSYAADAHSLSILSQNVIPTYYTPGSALCNSDLTY